MSNNYEDFNRHGLSANNVPLDPLGSYLGSALNVQEALEELESSIITDHGNLNGLLDDDHTQYLLLAGRSGGQQAYGGTASGDDLLFNSTSNATKGYIGFGNLSTGVIYDETNNRLGIGKVPSYKLDIDGNINIPETNGIYFDAIRAISIVTSTIAGQIVLGREAGLGGTEGIHMGYRSGSNDSGSGNLCFGWRTANSTMSGNNNVLLGTQAGQNMGSGSGNFCGGVSAGRFITVGSNNVCLGASSGFRLVDGNSNFFLGASTGYETVDGDFNVAIGGNALEKNVSGESNVAVGGQSAQNILSSLNTCVGVLSSRLCTTGEHQTSIGYQSLNNNLTGDDNTTIGYRSGFSILGSGNVCLGANAGYNETGSNKLYIANSNTSTPLIGGDFSASTLSLQAAVTINDLGSDLDFRVEGVGQPNALFVQGSDGKVGMGCVPSYLLDTRASNLPYIRVTSTANASTGVRIKRDETAGSYNDEWVWYMPADSTDLRLYNGSDLLTITSAGNVDIDGNITADNLNIANWDTAYGWGDHDGIYLKLVGVSGGQQAYGGTDSGDDLLFNSTSNATKGYIGFGSLSTGIIYDEVNNNLGIGGVPTLGKLEVVGNVAIGGSNNELRFYEGVNYVGFEAPALTADQIWVLPDSDGTADQVLTTDGSGNLSWEDGGGGGTTTFWSDDALTTAYASATTFTVTGSDETDVFTPGRLIRITNTGVNSGNPFVARVQSSAFSSDTTVTVNTIFDLADATLTVELSNNDVNSITYADEINVVASDSVAIGGAILPSDCIILGTLYRLEVSPTGSASTCDVHVGGTTIHTSKPSISDGGNITAFTRATTTSGVANAEIEFYIDSAGSTIAGGSVRITVFYVPNTLVNAT